MQSPKTKILLLAIFPRGEKPKSDRDKLAEASRLAAAETVDNKHVFYQDIGARFRARRHPRQENQSGLRPPDAAGL